MTRIDVICPVYREAAGIDAFHDRLARALSGIDGVAFGILYVLDPSPDASEVRLRAIAARDPRVRVLVMLRRFGHQAALLAGLEASRAEAAITMDADGQHPPEAIREFVTRHRAGADVVHGVRGRSAYAPWGERIAARWFYRLHRRITGLDLPEGAADFRLLSRRAIDALAAFPERALFLRSLIVHLELPTATVAYRAEPRHAGRSSYAAATRLALALSGTLAFSKAPLRAASALGVVAAGAALAFVVTQLIGVVRDGTQVPGWATLVALVTFLAGAQLIVLGVIGEYLGLIFDEVKRRPRYLISHEHGAGAGGES